MKTFQEFVDAVFNLQADTTKGLTRKEVEEVIRLVGDAIANIKDDDKIRLLSHNGCIGKFVLVTLAAKKGVSGASKLKWSKPERKTIRFKSKPKVSE